MSVSNEAFQVTVDRKNAEIEHLRDALSDIAKQRLVVEMDNETIEDADFEGGYDRLIEIARKALQPQN